MPGDSNLDQKQLKKSATTPVRVWVLLGSIALFLLIVLFAIVYLVTTSIQSRRASIVRPVPSATPRAPQNSPKETPVLPSPEKSPTPERSLSESPTATSELSASSPESTPEFTPESPSPVPSANASPSSSESIGSSTEFPTPSPASKATPPPVVANAQEEDVTRKEVLKRIDMMPELNPKEKDYLYSQVERARGFTKLAIIPYGSGQLWPDSFQTNYLLENLAKPQIAKIFEDPTVVLVFAGFSDLKGSNEHQLEISRDRAENLIKLLQKKTKIANLMRAVGMGGSDIFDKMHLEKNRVVEMWVVRP
jgi:hypothetical protein